MSQPEELIVVTDFGDLRAGDLVVLKPCNFCGESHRGMLTVFNNDEGYGPSGEVFDSDGWELAPDPSCCGPDESMDICVNAVVDRVVYRVQVPPASEVREAARPKKLERSNA